TAASGWSAFCRWATWPSIPATSAWPGRRWSASPNRLVHAVCLSARLNFEVTMSKQKRRSPGREPDLPRQPEPAAPLPGVEISPEPRPEPSSPGESIPRQGRGLVDPRHFSPAPPDLSPGVGTPLEVEPLSGPTEASADTPAPAEPGR